MILSSLIPQPFQSFHHIAVDVHRICYLTYIDSFCSIQSTLILQFPLSRNRLRATTLSLYHCINIWVDYTGLNHGSSALRLSSFFFFFFSLFQWLAYFLSSSGKIQPTVKDNRYPKANNPPIAVVLTFMRGLKLLIGEKGSWILSIDTPARLPETSRAGFKSIKRASCSCGFLKSVA